MKKLVSILMLLFLLAGCNPVHDGPAATTSLPTTVTASAATEVAPVNNLDLLENMVPVQDGGSLYRVKSELLDFLWQFSDILLYNDCLLLGRFPEPLTGKGPDEPVSYQLLLMDVQTGEIRANTNLKLYSAAELHGFGDRVFLTDYVTGTLYILDSNLNFLNKMKVASEWTYGYVDPACTYVYTTVPSKEIHRTDLKTGETVRLYSNVIDVNVYYGKQYGDYLPIGYVDKQTLLKHNACIKLSTGELFEAPFSDHLSSTSYCNGLWLSQSAEDDSVSFWGTDKNSVILKREDGNYSNYSLLDGPAPLCLTTYTEDSRQLLSFYHEDGTLFTSCCFDIRDAYISTPIWCESRNGYFLRCSNADGKTELLFLDASHKSTGKNLVMMPIPEPQALTGNAVSQSLYDRAHALSEQYGVEIRIADLCETSFYSFDVAQIFDSELIMNGLDALERVLRSYPDNFMPQLLYGNYRKIEINLTGSLTATNIPDDANAYTSFAAFVTHNSGKHIMVADITLGGLEQTMYHEFSHIIDSRLEFASNHLNTLYSEEAWSELNPEGFEYAGSVYVIPDDYYHDGYDGYFIDTYARTHATEDRARIMEYAMMDYSWAFEGVYQAPLREKLAFYSASIRDSFDTSGWPVKTQWELPLNGYVYTVQNESDKAA